MEGRWLDPCCAVLQARGSPNTDLIGMSRGDGVLWNGTQFVRLGRVARIDADPRIGALRSQGFQRPLGLDKDVHEAGHDLRDPFDDPSWSEEQYLTTPFALDAGVGGIRSTLRKTRPPQPGEKGPIEVWTSGDWRPPRDALTISRAATADDSLGCGLYEANFLATISEALWKSVKNIIFLVLENFPLTPMLITRFGCTVERGVEVANCYGHESIRCCPGDGVDYQVLPMRLRLNARTRTLAQCELRRVQGKWHDLWIGQHNAWTESLQCV